VSLRVLVDGTAMADEAARAFWERFSAWMEDHHGDLGGFARTEGLASVRPEMHAGEPVLIASRSAGQGAYAPAARMATAAKAKGSAPSARTRSRETPRKRRR
jgi:hypothetical protein